MKQTEEYQIAVLVTCHNRKQKTLAFLASLTGQEIIGNLQIDIYLLDDGSTDGTGDAVAGLYPFIKLIKGPGDLFWAGGMRTIWKHAIAQKAYDIFLLFNDDVVLTEGALERLLNCYQKVGKKGVVLVGSTLSPVTGTISYGGHTLYDVKHAAYYSNIPDETETIPCHLGNANVLLVDALTVQTIGVFLDDYIHSVADFDYTQSAFEAGMAVLIAPGYYGYCEDDHGVNWLSGKKNSLRKRIDYLHSPKGLAYREYLLYIKKHFPADYISSVTKLWLKTFFPIIWDKFKRRDNGKLRVVLLNNDFRVYWKGRLVYLHEYLAAQKIELYAVELFGKGSPYDFDAVNEGDKWWTCLFPGKSSGELSGKTISSALKDTLGKIKPDIVIGPSIVFFAGALGLRWAKGNGAKFVMFDDGKTSQIKRSAVTQTIKDTLIGEVDALWLPSEKYDAEYTTLTKANDIHSFYGFDCVDNSHFKLPGQKTFDHQTITCVARLVPIKNLHNLLKAWKLIEAKKTGYKLVIIGSGPDLESLTRTKKGLRLSTVEFVGVVDNAAIPEYYFNTDALILPSLQESWGLVVNEAMAAGLPVLLSDKVNAAETLLKEGVNGYSFNPMDINGMISAIMRFIHLTVAEKENMSQQSLAIIDGMNYDQMGQQLYTAIKKISQQKSSSPGIFPLSVIKMWDGKYNTSSWDKL